MQAERERLAINLESDEEEIVDFVSEIVDKELSFSFDNDNNETMIYAKKILIDGYDVSGVEEHESIKEHYSEIFKKAVVFTIFLYSSGELSSKVREEYQNVH